MLHTKCKSFFRFKRVNDAKNLPFVIEASGKIRLAHFYDLITTLIYPEISKKGSMRIRKESRFGWVFERHWQRMAEQAAIKFSYLEDILLDYSNRLPSIANELADDFWCRKLLQANSHCHCSKCKTCAGLYLISA
jgi:hypothetical protein